MRRSPHFLDRRPTCPVSGIPWRSPTTSLHVRRKYVASLPRLQAHFPIRPRLAVRHRPDVWLRPDLEVADDRVRRRLTAVGISGRLVDWGADFYLDAPAPGLVVVLYAEDDVPAHTKAQPHRDEPIDLVRLHRSQWSRSADAVRRAIASSLAHSMSFGHLLIRERLQPEVVVPVVHDLHKHMSSGKREDCTHHPPRSRQEAGPGGSTRGGDEKQRDGRSNAATGLLTESPVLGDATLNQAFSWHGPTSRSAIASLAFGHPPSGQLALDFQHRLFIRDASDVAQLRLGLRPAEASAPRHDLLTAGQRGQAQPVTETIAILSPGRLSVDDVVRLPDGSVCPGRGEDGLDEVVDVSVGE